MPELAEIETLKNYMQEHIIGEQIVDLTKRRNNLRYLLSDHLSKHVKNAIISNVRRIAKFLILELNNSYDIIFHLGMSGRLTIQNVNYIIQKHDHIIINLNSTNRLVFNDARRFGMVYSCKHDQISTQNFLKNMGQEPLEAVFDSKYLVDKLAKKKTLIKNAIMDSKIVVGVGNIYASESLFVAKINPEKQADKVTKIEVNLLVDAIKEVLHRAIKAGGTTLKDFVGGDNKPGYFKQELNVYDREGMSCYLCNKLIKKIKQSGRSSYYCPNCQK